MRLKVLSIDWDYFVDASYIYRARYFPDGGEFSPTIENHVWGGRYSAAIVNKSPITNIGIKEKEYKDICTILKNHKDLVAYSIGLSHKSIIDFLIELRKEQKEHITKTLFDIPLENIKFDITNIDFHHDIYTTNDQDDCGNWALNLNKKYNMLNSYTWIKQKDSDEFDHNILTCQSKESDNIKDILNERYDAIFICKSTLWSPPHLDNKFNKMCECLIGKIDENNILFNKRYTKTFKNYVEQEVVVIKEVDKLNRNNGMNVAEALDVLKEKFKDAER